MQIHTYTRFCEHRSPADPEICIYNLLGVFTEEEDCTVTNTIVQGAITTGLRLLVKSQIATRKIYVFKAIEASKTLLIPYKVNA